MNHLIDFVVSALAGCTIFLNFTQLLKKDKKDSKSPIIRRKTKKKVHNCQTVKWAKTVRNCIKIGKISSFQMNSHTKPISFANFFPFGF